MNIPKTTSIIAIFFSVFVNAIYAQLPSGWSSVDIGAPSSAGSSTYAGGTFTVNGSGNLIPNLYNNDQFQYAYRTYTGDFVAVARMLNITPIAYPGAPFGGLMLRGSLDPRAPYAIAGLRSISPLQYYWGRRFHQGDAVKYLSGPNTPTNAWVRLTRKGDKIAADFSEDGASWYNAYGEIIDNLPATVYVGFAAASRASQLTALTADSFSITPLQITHESSWMANSVFGGNYLTKHVLVAVEDIAVSSTGTLVVAGANESRGFQLYDTNGNWITYGDGGATSGGNYRVAGDSNAIYNYSDNSSNVGQGIEQRRLDGTLWAGPVLAGLKVGGLAAYNNRVYFSDTAANKVRVLLSGSLTEQTAEAFTVASPGRMASDGTGNLWVVQGGTSVGCYAVTTGSLVAQINLPSGTIPGGIAVEPGTKKVYITDKSAHQYVLIYNSNGTSAGTFGADGGMFSTAFSTIPGQAHSQKFNNPVAVAFDPSNNLYVGCGSPAVWWCSGHGSGTELRKFNTSRSQVWERLGLTFVDNADFVPGTDGLEMYTKDRHFTMDYTQPIGQQWAYKGTTLNPFIYPNDQRIVMPWSGGANVRVIAGQKFLFVSSMSSQSIAVYRFVSGSEVAIPAGLFMCDPYHGQSNNGIYIWVDANGNGVVDSGEETITAPALGTVWGFTIDDNGNFWGVNNVGSATTVYRYRCNGLNSYGVPLYGPSLRDTWTLPSSDFYTASDTYNVFPLRAIYSVSDDALYVGGYPVARPRDPNKGSAKGVGSGLARYTGWINGSKTKAWTISLPYEPNRIAVDTKNTVFIMASIALAGDYVFTVYGPTGEINVYQASTGVMVDKLAPGPDICGGTGLVDIVGGLNAVRRNNGEYVLAAEDDGAARVALYRWRPPGQLFSANFQDGVNPFVISTGTTGSMRMLQNVPFTGNKGIEFTDTSVNGENGGTKFRWRLTGTDPVVQRINQVLTGTTPASFIFKYKVKRTLASSSPVYGNMQGYLEAGPSDGNPPANGGGRDRFWTGEAGMGAISGYQNSQFITVDETAFPQGYQTAAPWRGYLFTVTPDGTGKTITELNIGFHVRVNGGATPESYMVDDIEIYETE